MNLRRAARFWTAPVLWRFGFIRPGGSKSARGLAQSKTLAREDGGSGSQCADQRPWRLARNTESGGTPRPVSQAALPLFATLGLALVLCGCGTARPQTEANATPSAVNAEARLKELNLELPPPSRMPATITGLVRVGNLAFVSGHISRRADGALITGRVGEDLDVAAGKAAARQCGLAILSSLRNDLGSLNRVKRVVKVLGMVNCPPGFKDQPAVINGCSELFLDVFGKEAGLGARSAVGMSSLPSNVAVEVEAVFELRP